MANLNFLLSLNAYSDRVPSNAPSKSNFKWENSLNGFPVENPTSLEFSLAPGETKTLFDGTRTLTQDNTTQYSVALAPGQTNQYRLSWVGGTAPGFRPSRTSGADATTGIIVTSNGPVMTLSSAPDTFATFIGQVAGMTTNIIITADNDGPGGNAVSLPFDGVTTITAAILAWNTANPGNTIALTSGNGAQIPDNATTINLTGGANHTALDLIVGGVVVGDYVRLGDLFNLENQGEWQIISLTATTLSVVNYGTALEGPIYLGSGFASQLDIYSSSGVQKQDTLVISGGFSPVTQGNYIITDVSDLWIQFSSTSVLPTEGPITTESITVYSNAQRLVYLESDQHVTMTLNGVAGNEIEPLIKAAQALTGCGSCPKVHPGIFMRTSLVYSMTVTNASQTTANLFFAAVE